MRTIGGCEILGILGRGTMGKVYRVRIPVLGKTAALKCLDPAPRTVEHLGWEALRKRFLFEASVIGGLRHPGIVEIWHLGEDNGRLYYIMEYFCRNLGTMMGESYWADMPARVIPLTRTIPTAVGILEALIRLHAAGIVHRDIKPFNIMLTDQNAPKIADFGLSRRRGEQPVWTEDAFIGTRGYAAPEQEKAPDAVDARADLYSVGVLLHRMLTGRLPGDPAQRQTVSHGIPEGKWRSFLKRALAETPDTRYPDASGMLSDLLSIEADWRESADTVCHPVIGEHAGMETGAAPAATRKTLLGRKAGLVKRRKVQEVFSVDDLGRPRTFETVRLRDLSKDLIEDPLTGLIWQRSGALFTMNWDEAAGYAQSLNAARFGDLSAWRLPTVNELLSLLRLPDPESGFCANPKLDKRQDWIWSADRRSLKKAWCVNMEIGFVSSEDMTGYFFTRAVCDPPAAGAAPL